MHLCGSNTVYNFYSANTGVLKDESQNRSRGFKLSKMKFSTFNVPNKVDVVKAGEGIQMEMREAQCDSFLKEEGSDACVPNLLTFPHTDIVKHSTFL